MAPKNGNGAGAMKHALHEAIGSKSVDDIQRDWMLEELHANPEAIDNMNETQLDELLALMGIDMEPVIAFVRKERSNSTGAFVPQTGKESDLQDALEDVRDGDMILPGFQELDLDALTEHELDNVLAALGVDVSGVIEAATRPQAESAAGSNSVDNGSNVDARVMAQPTFAANISSAGANGAQFWTSMQRIFSGIGYAAGFVACSLIAIAFWSYFGPPARHESAMLARIANLSGRLIQAEGTVSGLDETLRKLDQSVAALREAIEERKDNSGDDKIYGYKSGWSWNVQLAGGTDLTPSAGRIRTDADGNIEHKGVLAAEVVPGISASITNSSSANSMPLAGAVTLKSSKSTFVYQGSAVPYARSATGIDVKGNAGSWWANADGLYARGSQPEAGSVMNFRATDRMRLGHVAVVTRVIDSRTVQIDHANWAGPGATKGGVSRGIPVIDVSENNDWSAVRVGIGPGSFGGVHPTYGFIYDRPGRPENGTAFAHQSREPATAHLMLSYTLTQFPLYGAGQGSSREAPAMP